MRVFSLKRGAMKKCLIETIRQKVVVSKVK